MTTFEYTYLWWEGSTTDTTSGRLGDTTPPIGEEVMDKINGLASDGWQVDQITAAPLTTGWLSPSGRVGTTSITNTVHYMAILKRATTD